MSEKNENIGTNIGKEFGSILKNLKIKEIETEPISISDREPVLKNGKALGADVRTIETARKEKVDPELEKVKKITLQKIEDLNFDIKELEREGKKGFEILAEKKEAELKKLESKINDLNKTGDAVEDSFPKEPQVGLETIRPAKKEKEQDLKNEIDQKYSNVLKTKRFNDKGDELYIQEYNKGKIKCFVTEKGKKPSPIILSQSQFDDVLKEYARVDETIRRIIPVNKTEQETKPETENKEIKEKIEGETLGLERLCKAYYEMYCNEKRIDWSDYSKKEKNDFLKSTVGSFARKTIRTKAEFLKDLGKKEKEEIIEKIKQKMDSSEKESGTIKKENKKEKPEEIFEEIVKNPKMESVFNRETEDSGKRQRIYGSGTDEYDKYKDNLKRNLKFFLLKFPTKEAFEAKEKNGEDIEKIIKEKQAEIDSGINIEFNKSVLKSIDFRKREAQGENGWESRFGEKYEESLKEFSQLLYEGFEKYQKEKTKKTEQCILDAKSFDDLYKAIKISGGIQGSQEFFKPKVLVGLIERLREGSKKINTITSSFGLRQKVEELLTLEKV